MHQSEKPVKRRARDGGTWFRWDTKCKTSPNQNWTGKRWDKKIIKVVSESEKWNYLSGWDQQKSKQSSTPDNFKKRVMHKRHADIIKAETKKQVKPPRQKPMWTLKRSKKLQTRQQPHGFNPICWKKQHTPRKGHEILLGVKPHVKLRKEKSGSMEAKEYAKLRSAGSRFYCPLPKNNKYVQQRVERIRLEGLPSHDSRTSSSIGFGRGDLPSYGVKDNFEKSLYYKKEKTKARSKLNSKATKYKPQPDWWQ